MKCHVDDKFRCYTVHITLPIFIQTTAGDSCKSYWTSGNSSIRGMVRFKKRYFVVELERSERVARGKCDIDMTPLDSRDLDLAEAMKDKVKEMYGDFGRAQITVGFKVIYANKLTRLVILRCRHSAQDLLSSCIPLLDKVRKDSVIARLLYTGATIRHCHLFMVKRQKKLLESLKCVPKEDVEEKILDLQRIDAF